MEILNTQTELGEDSTDIEFKPRVVSGVVVWRQKKPTPAFFTQVGNSETIERRKRFFATAYDRCLREASRLAQARGAKYVFMRVLESSLKGFGAGQTFSNLDATYLKVELTFYRE